jgi:hypothetical protein
VFYCRPDKASNRLPAWQFLHIRQPRVPTCFTYIARHLQAASQSKGRLTYFHQGRFIIDPQQLLCSCCFTMLSQLAAS